MLVTTLVKGVSDRVRLTTDGQDEGTLLLPPW
jgi:hypothetical protein